MTSIVVYGKPRGFESCEYVFGGAPRTAITENTHREPVLKPKSCAAAAVHYFVKDGMATLEYYTRAKGFESDRDGIVFGLALKSSKDFNLADTLARILKPFHEELTGILLDHTGKFRKPGIIDSLRGMGWSQDEQRLITSTANRSPVQPATRGLLLLTAPGLAGIGKAESRIKEYADVYIADSDTLFKDPLNKVLLQEANGRIFLIDRGAIKPLAEKEDESKSTDSNDRGKAEGKDHDTAESKDNTAGSKNSTAESKNSTAESKNNDSAGSSDSPAGEETAENTPRPGRWRRLADRITLRTVAVAVVVAVAFTLLLVCGYFLMKKSAQPAAGADITVQVYYEHAGSPAGTRIKVKVKGEEAKGGKWTISEELHMLEGPDSNSATFEFKGNHPNATITYTAKDGISIHIPVSIQQP